MTVSRTTRLTFLVCFVSALYFLTRAGNLGRDLASEEAVFLMPGRFLLEGRGYYFDWGVFDPHSNAFHKPPLTSLLLGLFSFIGHDSVAGARLLPFLVGLGACLMPLVTAESSVPSLLVLMSPFFYGAASHMQTDPTVGLLGYGLACWGIARIPRSNAYAQGLLIVGIVFLWLGKVESAVIMSTVIFVGIIWQPSGNRMSLFKAAALSTAVGVSLLVFVSWILGRTASLPFNESVANVFQTVTRVTTSTLAAHASNANAGIHERALLLRYALDFKVPHLFVLCLVPALVVMARYRHLWSRQRPHAVLLVAAIMPVAAYMAVSYSGDGFPRYFLIAFPPLLMLLGLCLQELSQTWRILASILLLGVGAAMMMPQTLQAIHAPGSPTVFRGEEGTRQSALLIASLTKPGDLVVGPDNAAYYVRDRRWMVDDSFLPYPALHARALAMAPELRAVMFKADQNQGVMGQLIEAIERSGATLYKVGSYEVVVARPH